MIIFQGNHFSGKRFEPGWCVENKIAGEILVSCCRSNFRVKYRLLLPKNLISNQRQMISICSAA
jgi:hypothetical protein